MQVNSGDLGAQGKKHIALTKEEKWNLIITLRKMVVL